MTELIQEERVKLERKEFDRKIDVEPCGPISREERETAKELRRKKVSSVQLFLIFFFILTTHNSHCTVESTFIYFSVI